MKQPQILFSTKFRLAHQLECDYYGKHFVYCTTKIHSAKQPPTSDPLDIAYMYYRIARTGEKHYAQMEDKKATLIAVARDMVNKKVISSTEERIIVQRIQAMDYSDFYPLLYIISYNAVKNKITIVSDEEKASKHSVEYKVENMTQADFQVFYFHDFYANI